MSSVRCPKGFSQRPWANTSNPWRYCFAYIADRPAKEFFLLHDAFVEDEILLYSPGIEAYWAESRKQDLYFLLLGFNGQCWQSYGIIVAMRSFTPDDIYFYGTEGFDELTRMLIQSGLHIMQESTLKRPKASMTSLKTNFRNVLVFHASATELERFIQ